jgi:hypothetical protein
LLDVQRFKQAWPADAFARAALAEVEAETQRRQRKLQQGESSPLLMTDASSSTFAAAL